MPTLVPLWFAAGLVWWTLLEYLLHRFAFHGGVATAGLRHRAHHANVRDRDLSLASPEAMVLGLGLHALALVPTLGSLAGGAALAGVAAGYAAYEWVHLALHRPRPRGRLLRRLRRHHLLHHGAQPDARFGVTTTLWDRAFGTMEPPDRPPRCAPAPVVRRERWGSIEASGRGDRGLPIDRPGELERSAETRFARIAAIPGLSRRQARVARAVAESLLADQAGSPPRARVEAAVREVGAFARRAGPQTRLGFRAALLVVQFSPLLFFGRLQRFTRAPLALRIACFERLEAGRLGILAVVLKLSLCLAYFEQPEGLAETGYDGPGLPRTPRPPTRAAFAPAPEERA